MLEGLHKMMLVTFFEIAVIQITQLYGVCHCLSINFILKIFSLQTFLTCFILFQFMVFVKSKMKPII